jgi:hypothetical protein
MEQVQGFLQVGPWSILAKVPYIYPGGTELVLIALRA